MTDQPKITSLQLVAAIAAEQTRETIQTLTAKGLPLDSVLSGILGEAVSAFASDQGWGEAAALLEELARQARTLQEPGGPELAGAQVAGRA